MITPCHAWCLAVCLHGGLPYYEQQGCQGLVLHGAWQYVCVVTLVHGLASGCWAGQESMKNPTTKTNTLRIRLVGRRLVVVGKDDEPGMVTVVPNRLPLISCSFARGSPPTHANMMHVDTLALPFGAAGTSALRFTDLPTDRPSSGARRWVRGAESGGRGTGSTGRGRADALRTRQGCRIGGAQGWQRTAVCAV